LSFWQDWYYLSKTLAEREAFAYAAKTGLDIVTICPSLVIGPLMQSTVNASSKVLLKYFKGGCVYPTSFPLFFMQLLHKRVISYLALLCLNWGITNDV
jgi:nucleoside-diphosphate-sugar epimerase